MSEYITTSGSAALSGGVSESFSVPIEEELKVIPSDATEIAMAQKKLSGVFRLMDGKLYRIIDEEPPKLGALKIVGLSNGNDTPNVLSEGDTR